MTLSMFFGSVFLRSSIDIPAGIMLTPEGCMYVASSGYASPLRRSWNVLGYRGMPIWKPRLGVVRFVSITMTRLLKSFNASARFDDNVVLPTPPLPEARHITRVILTYPFFVFVIYISLFHLEVLYI